MATMFVKYGEKHTHEISNTNPFLSTCHEQPVSNLEPAVLLRRPAINDLGNIYAVVTRDVLVPNTTSNTEAKSCVNGKGVTTQCVYLCVCVSVYVRVCCPTFWSFD